MMLRRQEELICDVSLSWTHLGWCGPRGRSLFFMLPCFFFSFLTVNLPFFLTVTTFSKFRTQHVFACAEGV